MPRIYTLTEIEAAIANCESFETDLMDAVARGFCQYSRGHFAAAPIVTLGAPPMPPFVGDNIPNYAAQTCVKSGYVSNNGQTFVIKVASGGHPHHCNSGNLQVYSQHSGQLECILLDDGLLTEHRTAAAGALAAKVCFFGKQKQPNNNDNNIVVQAIGVLGTGVQARYQLRYLRHVTKCRNVLVWGRNKDHVQEYIQEMTPHGWNLTPVSDPNQLLTVCDLIVTTTSSRTPLLHANALLATTGKPRKRPQHISCMGSDAPGKCELDASLLLFSDSKEPTTNTRLIVDSKAQCVERGELASLLQSGDLDLDRDVVEIGSVLEEEEDDSSVQQQQTPFTIFDSSGVAVQDCAVAELVSQLLSQPNNDTNQ